eukprot:gene9213-16344_t
MPVCDARPTRDAARSHPADHQSNQGGKKGDGEGEAAG